jgi:hypothetical protein
VRIEQRRLTLLVPGFAQQADLIERERIHFADCPVGAVY